MRIEKQQQIDGQIAKICNSIATDLCMQFHQQYPSVNASVIERNKSQLISTVRRLTGNLWAQSYHKDIVDKCITHAVLRRCWTQVVGAAQVNSVQLDQGTERHAARLDRSPLHVGSGKEAARRGDPGEDGLRNLDSGQRNPEADRSAV